jgi:hypothetical protein
VGASSLTTTAWCRVVAAGVESCLTLAGKGLDMRCGEAGKLTSRSKQLAVAGLGSRCASPKYTQLECSRVRDAVYRGRTKTAREASSKLEGQYTNNNP